MAESEKREEKKANRINENDAGYEHGDHDFDLWRAKQACLDRHPEHEWVDGRCRKKGVKTVNNEAKSKKTGKELSDRKGEKKFRSKWDKEKAKDAEDTRNADTDKEFSNAAGAGRVRHGREDTDHDPQGYNEDTDVKRFISQVSQKNYAEANKYLRAALEDKMKSRIAATQHKLGF